MQQVIKVAEYNTPLKGHLVDTILPFCKITCQTLTINHLDFLLIGQICGDNIAQTPALIKNGILPTMYKTVCERFPESGDTFNLFLFAFNHTTLQDEGRKLAEDLNVFERILTHMVENIKFSETPSSYSVNTRTYLFNLFERMPSFKAIANKFLKTIIKQAMDISESQDKEYFKVYNRTDIDLKQKNEILSSPEFTECESIKKLKAIIIMIGNFCGNDERSREPNVNARVVSEIFDEEAVKALLDINELVAQSPCLSNSFSQSLCKFLRVLVEQTNYAANVKLFVEKIDKVH